MKSKFEGGMSRGYRQRYTLRTPAVPELFLTFRPSNNEINKLSNQYSILMNVYISYSLLATMKPHSFTHTGLLCVSSEEYCCPR